FTHQIPYSHDDYEADSFVHLVEPLGIEAGHVEIGAPFITLPEAAVVKAAGLLESLNDEPLAVIFPGASIAERRWGAERYGRVAKRLQDVGLRVVVVGGREDQDDGEKIAGDSGLNL